MQLTPFNYRNDQAHLSPTPSYRVDHVKSDRLPDKENNADIIG